MEIKDLKLPTRKFKEWREGQEKIVETILESLTSHKVFLLDAPTGIGKSLAAVAVARCISLKNEVMERLTDERLFKPRCIYVTRTKQLQDQLLKDFEILTCGIKGRRNYPCARYPSKFPEVTAEDCRKNCGDQYRCQYYQAKKEAARAPISVLNYSYFLTEANGVGIFSGAELIVLDEFDSLEGELMNFVEFSVSTKQLRGLGLIEDTSEGLLLLPLSNNPLEWKTWAHSLAFRVTAGIQSIERQLPLDEQSWGTMDLKACKKVSALERFEHKLRFFYDHVDSSWVSSVKEEPDGNKTWTFKPVFISKFAHLFLSHGDKILGMSGSILDPKIMAENLGLQDWDYLKVDSPFKTENRPLYYVPAANLTRKSMQDELPKLCSAVERIMQLYPDDKMLVHTTSYPVRDYLQFRLDLSRIITHDATNRNEKIEEFKASSKPLVMLSPSFDRGLDLPYSDCRVIIIAKIPYPDLGDNQIKARMETPGGGRWYLLRTVQTIIQMSGRGVRAEDDFCRCFILDAQFSKVFKRAKHLFPDWWLSAFSSKIEEAIHA